MNDQRRFLLSVVFREWTSVKKIISTEQKITNRDSNKSYIECNVSDCKMCELWLSRRMLQAVL